MSLKWVGSLPVLPSHHPQSSRSPDITVCSWGARPVGVLWQAWQETRGGDLCSPGAQTRLERKLVHKWEWVLDSLLTQQSCREGRGYFYFQLMLFIVQRYRIAQIHLGVLAAVCLFTKCTYGAYYGPGALLSPLQILTHFILGVTVR